MTRPLPPIGCSHGTGAAHWLFLPLSRSRWGPELCSDPIPEDGLGLHALPFPARALGACSRFSLFSYLVSEPEALCRNPSLPKPRNAKLQGSFNFSPHQRSVDMSREHQCEF